MECRNCIKGTSPEIWAFSCFISGMNPALNFNLFFLFLDFIGRNTKSQIYFKHLIRTVDHMNHNNLRCQRLLYYFSKNKKILIQSSIEHEKK